MPDERWEQIHARRLTLSPPGHRLVTPVIPHPTCPEHCRRHTVDSVIACRRCGREAYHVLAHEWPQSEGHAWHSTVPVNGAALYDKTPICCGEPMRRT